MARKQIFLLAPALVFFTLLAFVIPARAETGGTAGVKLQPSIIEEKVEPGATFSGTIHATNVGAETRTFFVIKRDISSLMADGNPVLAEEGGKTSYELSAWINVAKGGIEIPAGGTRDVPFFIAVPKDAGPGGHFGIIFLATSAERPKETGAGIGFQVGTIISLRVDGDVIDSAQIREFRSDRIIYNKPIVNFITRIENLGNTVIRPRGPLEIIDWWGKKTATLVMNEDAAAILPKSVRSFGASWAGEDLAFGRYQAIMTLTYGDEDKQNLDAALSFWVVPLNIVLPVSGGILAAILLVIILTKLHIKKQLRELRPSAEQESRERNAPWSRPAVIIVVLLALTLVFLLVLSIVLAWS